MSDEEDSRAPDPDEDPEDEGEAWKEPNRKRRGGRISIAHAVNLIVAGPETAAKLNQLDALMRRLPAVKSKYLDLLTLLDELGFNPAALVRRDKRLAALANGLAELLPELEADSVYSDTLDFTIAGSPLLSSRRMLRAHTRRLPGKARVCLLSLADGSLRISIRDWAVSVPAIFDAPGACIVRRSFVDILLEALKTDEVIRCHVEPGLYRVNGFTHQAD